MKANLAAGMTSAATRRGASKTSSAPTPSPVAPPAPEPVKLLSMYGEFLKRIGDIFAGKVSDPADLYSPTTVMDLDEVVTVGVVTGQKAREFFSLSIRLKEQSQQLPLPRNAGEVYSHTDKVRELVGLAEKASEFAWVCVKDEFPAQCNRSSMSLVDGWIIVRARDREDELREEVRQECLSPEQADAFVARQLNEERKERHRVSFKDIEKVHGHRSRSTSQNDEGLGMLEDIFRRKFGSMI